MKEIVSEPACQHFFKQNSFQFVPELYVSLKAGFRGLGPRLNYEFHV